MPCCNKFTTIYKISQGGGGWGGWRGVGGVSWTLKVELQQEDQLPWTSNYNTRVMNLESWIATIRPKAWEVNQERKD
jgi:hypothetical protein